ncbi:hypothetical protein KKE19_01480 [Patescibacteria group bacterium]|nr:hypothetical protein [Patescibacteria group bacterium]MBU4274464.1 hypothetical protein [Patescibacteria group bacterium]MBU4367937.1 hypothetical protein [Patescibacteria group bacterium]MBU4462275.1 hypothetical protein [Patescibacteria group bacterium]MCG2699547.1 hypothetical protein [Candidatus Parcubacteria bacterium]
MPFDHTDFFSNLPSLSRDGAFAYNAFGPFHLDAVGYRTNLLANADAALAITRRRKQDLAQFIPGISQKEWEDRYCRCPKCGIRISKARYLEMKSGLGNSWMCGNCKKKEKKEDELLENFMKMVQDLPRVALREGDNIRERSD